jgi:phosphate uptake regulator
MGSASHRRRAVRVTSRVVDLAHARDARRLRDLEDRCRAVDGLNRRSLARLFGTGLLYTRAGARLGRDLLLAHQHLLRVGDLLERIAALGADRERRGESGALYDEALELLSRTKRLTARTGLVLARGR